MKSTSSGPWTKGMRQGFCIMHESTAYEYLPHDHSIHLRCGMIDCHKLLSIFRVHTDSSSPMHCTSKKDELINGLID